MEDLYEFVLNIVKVNLKESRIHNRMYSRFFGQSPQQVVFASL